MIIFITLKMICFAKGLNAEQTWQKLLLSFLFKTQWNVFMKCVCTIGLLTGYSAALWMGLNDLDLNGGWQWADSAPLKYLNWETGKATPLTVTPSYIRTQLDIESVYIRNI